MALINCPECNKEISNEAKRCPYCGYPLKKVAKRNLPKFIISTAVVLLILCSIIGIIGFVFKPAGYYNNLKWGTSYTVLEEQISNADVLNKSRVENEKLTTFTENLFGHQNLFCYTVYRFNTGSLYEVEITCYAAEDDTDIPKLVADIIETYDKKFGDYTIIDGYYYWETKKSRIGLRDDGVACVLVHRDYNEGPFE